MKKVAFLMTLIWTAAVGCARVGPPAGFAVTLQEALRPPWNAVSPERAFSSPQMNTHIVDETTFAFRTSDPNIEPALYGGADRLWSGNINLIFGGEQMWGSRWEPSDRHYELGVKIDIRPPGWPVSLAVDFSHGWRVNAVTRLVGIPPFLFPVDFIYDSSVAEIDMGVRYVYEGFKNFRPFAGGGLAFIHGRVVIFNTLANFVETQVDDWGEGGWAEVGAYWTVLDHLNLGLSVKASWAQIRLEGFMLDITSVGGVRVGLFTGYHF